MRRFGYFLMAVLIGMVVSGCVGTQYIDRKDYKDLTVLQGGRTGPFGTDNSWVYVQEKQEPQPDVYELQESYSRQATIQEYRQNCPSPKQLKDIKTRTENIAETRSRQVVNPNKRPPVNYGAFGSSYSTGNLAVPAVFLGAGSATSGVLAPETKIITNVTAKGGKAAGGSASSSSASSASAAAASAAGN